MNQALVDRIVNAVLYEGYILYPYRPSVKNHKRWTFGGIYPRRYSESQSGNDRWWTQTEGLARGNGRSNPELLVRVDVTYLRQDFSAMLPVADAAPWPELQRFDFVARTRVVKDDEVATYQDKFDKVDVLPPNHRAALAALRNLTGQDAAPTAEAWRKVVMK